MITKKRVPRTGIWLFIIAIIMFGIGFLFPAANSALSEPGKQAPSDLKQNHNRLINESSPYVCQAFACKLPTTSIDQMLENLRQKYSID